MKIRKEKDMTDYDAKLDKPRDIWQEINDKKLSTLRSAAISAAIVNVNNELN